MTISPRCPVELGAAPPGLKPPDASHLASAIIANVDEMHTFDDDLLELDGKVQRIDGTDLKICKPSMGGPALPLLESPAEDSDAFINQTQQQRIGSGFRPALCDVAGARRLIGTPSPIGLPVRSATTAA